MRSHIDHISLHPLVALGYIFIKQKYSLLGMQESKEDTHVKLLYEVAKEATEHEIQE